MKQSKTCPKCGSKDILAFTEGYGKDGNYIYTGVMSVVPITRYLCCDCGYTEEYVRKAYIPDIINYYKK